MVDSASIAPIVNDLLRKRRASATAPIEDMAVEVAALGVFFVALMAVAVLRFHKRLD